ncbi:L,D-transpeptidase [Candidatus Parabeggiatoa sp. HSG14]|uniref:L,D-transpeptidase n=1 Tax=Candidatus Parabeggiatoa sp. HSG14 TaxID=3055593 RepID=UPI0025A84360|nr:L,D-transpeptidase [Thiotrichales bacterium HSG14]
MHLQLGQIKHFFNQKNFLRKLVFLLIVPLIFLSLVQCTMENTEPKESVNNEPIPFYTPPALIPVVAHNPQPIFQPLPIEVVKQMNSASKMTEPEPILLEKATIVVDISEQMLYLYEGDKAETDKMVKSYPVSTSKYGIGNQSGSGKTPLGKHYIKNKFGDGAPKGTIFKARQNMGKIAEMNAKDVGDLVTTRIMWLKGLERGKNSGRGIDSYKRYIYIHGTAEENKIGQPASHGCIRMYNSDVIDLFDRLKEGTRVDIRR